MKRRKTIRAADRSVKVIIEIKIEAAPGHWIREEVNGMAENLTSAIMEQIPRVRHLGMPLSEIKVQ